MPRKSERATITDRLPPHSPESEQGVLACVLTQPSLLTDCICQLRPGAAAFYDARHQLIYNTMLELYDDGVTIDTITLTERLQTWGHLEQVGGLNYVATLPDTIPSTQNLPDYLNIVMNKFMLRQVINVCTESASGAYESNGHSESFLAEVESRILGIRSNTESAGTFTNIAQSTVELTHDYEQAHLNQRPSGIATGYPDLDRICGGMLEQEMIVVAGLPSAGKTTLAINIAYNVASAGTTIGIISLETSGKKLVHRLACYTGKIEGGKLLRGKSDEAEIARLSAAFSRLIGLEDRLLISEVGGLEVKEVEAVARRMCQRGAKAIVIDYLQLLQCHAKSEFEQISKASRAIKSMAKRLNVPIIVVSAFNREPIKGQKPRPPKLSDLRMSGQIEYDADKVMLLYDSQLRTEFPPTEESRVVCCRVAKQKDGPLGVVELMFFTRQFRMESVAHDDEPPQPEPQEQEQEPSLPYQDQ